MVFVALWVDGCMILWLYGFDGLLSLCGFKVLFGFMALVALWCYRFIGFIVLWFVMV